MSCERENYSLLSVFMISENIDEIGIAILAAGTSSRMGQVKQLLPWGQTTLIGHVVRIAVGSKIGSVAVVLGANADQIIREINSEPVSLLQNPKFKNGPGTSVRAATQWAMEKKLRGLILMLGDQPLLTENDLKDMAGIAAKNPIVAASYEGSMGVPAFFSSEFYQELLELPDSQGAKSLLSKRSAKVSKINLEGRIIDIDTPEDYEKARQPF